MGNKEHVETLRKELSAVGSGDYAKKLAPALQAAIHALEALAAAVDVTEALTAMRAAGGQVSPRVAMAHAHLRKALKGE